jgi:putative addiction module killer protein
MEYELKVLLLASGNSPFADWFGKLEPVAAAKVRVGLVRLELGNWSNVEYKIDWGSGLRIYLARDGLSIILLLGGGTKKRQQRDIDQAIMRWEDYKRRKVAAHKGV